MLGRLGGALGSTGAPRRKKGRKLGRAITLQGGSGGSIGVPLGGLGGPLGRGWGVQGDLGGLKWAVGRTRGPFEEQGGRKRGFAKSFVFIRKTIHLATWRVSMATQNPTKGSQKQKMKPEESEKRARMAKRDQKRAEGHPWKPNRGKKDSRPPMGNQLSGPGGPRGRL